MSSPRRIAAVLAVLGCGAALAAGAAAGSSAAPALVVSQLPQPSAAVARVAGDRSASASALADTLTAGPSVALEIPRPEPAEHPEPVLLTGTVTLRADIAVPIGFTVTAVTFEIAPAEGPEAEEWQTVGKPIQARSSEPFEVTTSLSPAKEHRESGDYNLRAVIGYVEGATAGQASSNLLRDRLIANGEAAVALVSPQTPLHGAITLQAKQLNSSPVFAGRLQLQDCAITSPAEPTCKSEADWTPLGEPFGGAQQPTGASGETCLEPSEASSQQCPAPATGGRYRLADGYYDIRAQAAPGTGEEALVSAPLRGVLVDNTPPTVQLTAPAAGSNLGARVTLTATACDPQPGLGIAAVRFERANQGAENWRSIGEASVPAAKVAPGPAGASCPEYEYRHTTRTAAWTNATYEIRARAFNVAGDTAVSPAAQDLVVSNPPVTQPVTAVATGAAAPAHDISIIGTVAAADSPLHEAETWAYGLSTGPPAAVEGRRLQYTAEGNQFVLLRYTDKGGWQINSVLDDPEAQCGRPKGECAFPLVPAEEVPVAPRALGAMTASGEAWLIFGEDREEREETETGVHFPSEAVFGVFRRPACRTAPCEGFELDTAATSTLEPFLVQGTLGGNRRVLLNARDRLRLDQAADGDVFGTFTAPEAQSAAAGSVNVEGTGGATEPLEIKQATTYASLAGGAWSLQSAAGAVNPPVPTGLLKREDTLTLASSDVTGAGEAWGAFTITEPATEIEGGKQPETQRFVLGHLTAKGWALIPQLGLDALDATAAFAIPGTKVKNPVLKADGDAVWIGAEVSAAGPKGASGEVVARYELEPGGTSGRLTGSWCSLPVANSCEEPLGDASVPDAIFHESAGEVALSQADGAVDVYAGGQWSSIATPGYVSNRERPSGQPGGNAFTDPNEGWLGSAHTVGRWSAAGSASPLASWPLPDRSPLTSVALPPGSQAATGQSGALAVGLDGTILSYSASNGWLIDAAPADTHQVALLGVAFAGPSDAFAVGQFASILHWNGTAWSQDPQSFALASQSQLNAVAFAPSGEGWAVGEHGTILHYNGHSWGEEDLSSGVDITSVAVAGSEVFAVAGGNLITFGVSTQCSRLQATCWHAVESALLPSSLEKRPNSLRVVGALPDGGVVVGGASTVLVREAAGQSFEVAPQPIDGTAVAVAPFREGGKLRAYVSVVPSSVPEVEAVDAGERIPGDGDLLVQTQTGWKDLGGGEYAGEQAPEDGALKPDPVLAVVASPNGEHAWAVGGYAGTEDAIRQGVLGGLATRPVGWKTASLWRYDSSGSAHAPALVPATPSLPAVAGTVSFAFFTSPLCRAACSSVVDAQPNVNLSAAAAQIASYATQPGGPAFAMLGGDARGRLVEPGPTAEPYAGEVEEAPEFEQLSELLAPLGHLPIFAALGPTDYAAREQDATDSWSEAFGEAPAPFGSGPAVPGITTVAAGARTEDGLAHRYYAFDAQQNGGTLEVIVLDNSAGSLEASSPGQLSWLREQLKPLLQANAGGSPVPPAVVICAKRLDGTGAAADGEAVASLLAQAGVLAVFTTNPNQSDERSAVPAHPASGVGQIPEYQGASLTYQMPQNNGVLWYFASVDTWARQVHVSAVPVLSSLALKPLDGLTVPRSLTLQFEAVGRRPAGTLATFVSSVPQFPGYDNYAEIPPPRCEGSCVAPSYAFTSSEPAVGQFVEPSQPGSHFPKLNSSGHPIPSASSGLFCAYNAGTTTVSITAGLLTYSLPVTVEEGGFGPPCGTVYDPNAQHRIVTLQSQVPGRLGGALTPVAPSPVPTGGVLASAIAVPPPVVAPAPAPAAPAPTALAAPPAPVLKPPPAPLEAIAVPPAILPAAVPPVEPIPPGVGGYAQSSAPAERKEKAHKHASQSAFTLLAVAQRRNATRQPVATAAASGSGGAETAWFYAALGGMTALALLLAPRGLRGGPGLRPATVERRPRRSGASSCRAGRR